MLKEAHMKILTNDIFKISNPSLYKLHLGSKNDEGERPLDGYVANTANWLFWNEWRGKKNDWTRDYIFSMMEFYPKSHSWLFGGIFKVLERHEKYKLERVSDFEKYEGRLIISFHRDQGLRGRAFYLEKYFDSFEVKEILPQPYSGEDFCGCENIKHDFNILEAIIKNERSDWKAALSDVKGIYLISDKSNGKKYVGSAYGDSGIWSRWACYIETGHGNNAELTHLIKQNGIEYARKNFMFSLLEILNKSMANDSVLKREAYWKSILLTRTFGYNKN